MKIKYYPFTEFEKKRNITDIGDRFFSLLSTLSGVLRSDPTYHDDKLVSMDFFYRWGLLDYCTLGAFPFCLALLDPYENEFNLISELWIIEFLPLFIVAVFFAAIKFIVAAALSFPITGILTLSRIVTYPLTEACEQPSEDWKVIKHH